MRDAVVIGAGVAGLTAAIRLARAGRSTTLVTKGLGGLQLSQGTLDILGYAPDFVERPLDALAEYGTRDPGHPYAGLGAEVVRRGAEYLVELVGPGLLVGDPQVNLKLPTAVGAVRPTALAQPSMMAGQVVDGARFVIVGLKRLKDFYPALVADNLNRNVFGIDVSARSVSIDVPARAREADSSALTYARAFDDPSYRKGFVTALARHLEDGETVGLPAVLGIKDLHAWEDVQEQLGHKVFEIPLPPPSVPGMRLNERLTALAQEAGVRVIVGSKVIGNSRDGSRLTSVSISSAGRPRVYEARDFVFAPGGFESGAIHLDSYMRLSEPALGLPLRGADAPELIGEQYWDSEQPLFKVGVATDEIMRPVDDAGNVVCENLYAAGGILAGATRWAEKSGEGIAVASAVRAVDAILGEA